MLLPCHYPSKQHPKYALDKTTNLDMAPFKFTNLCVKNLLLSVTDFLLRRNLLQYNINKCGTFCQRPFSTNSFENGSVLVRARI